MDRRAEAVVGWVYPNLNEPLTQEKYVGRVRVEGWGDIDVEVRPEWGIRELLDLRAAAKSRPDWWVPTSKYLEPPYRMPAQWDWKGGPWQKG